MQWKEPKSAQISSFLLKPKQNLDFLVDQFSNATPENNNDSDFFFFFLLNIMVLTKCIMLKYLTKINLCPCFR